MPCRNRAGQIVKFDPDSSPARYEVLLEGEITPLPNKPAAPGEFCNDMAISSQGMLWFTDRINKRVILLRPDGSSATVASGWRPNGIVLSADQQTLVVTDSNVAVLHAFAVAGDGTLQEKADFFEPIRTVEALGQEDVALGRPGTDGMTVDSDGRFYAFRLGGLLAATVWSAMRAVEDAPLFATRLLASFGFTAFRNFSEVEVRLP